MVIRGRSGRNDRLVCRHTPETAPVFVAKDGFDLPNALAARGKTGFLALDVVATRAGRLREPLVEFQRAEMTVSQSFERGVRGPRHLNLSPLLRDERGSESTRVQLRGDSLRWTGEGSLTLFEPPPLTDATILVLAPHPDDAEIAAFGLYAGHPSSSWVVTVTAGERGAMNVSDVIAARDEMQFHWKASLRVWDSVTVPQLGAVPGERCLNLAYPDGALRAMAREPTRSYRLACEKSLSRPALRARNRDPDFQGGSVECTWANLVSELARLLDKAKPSIVVCPHPIIDHHPDHVFTTVALEQALHHSLHQAATFFLYVVHARDEPAYPFGSADSVVSLPTWDDGQWIADSIYSHPLSSELQRGKYFAVEASHDVRTYGIGAPRSFGQLLGTMKREVSAFVGGVAVDSRSFFLRRAPRPNELYYVASAESLSELVGRRSFGP